MHNTASLRDLDGAPAPAYRDVFTNVTGMIRRVRNDLRDELFPARWIVHEWTEYTLSFAGATHLRVGSRAQEPILTGGDGISHFRIRFENELELTVVQPLIDCTLSGEPLYLEVIAKKFNDERNSLAFVPA